MGSIADQGTRSPHVTQSKKKKRVKVHTKNITHHISKQNLLRPSNHQPLQPPPWCILSGFRMEKNRILALHS